MSTATPDAGGVPVRVGPERRADPVIWNVTRGAARFAFTWALARVANIGHRSAERSSGVDGEDVTASLGWNLPASCRAWDAATSEIAPCWSECGTEAFNTGLDGAAHLVEELGGACTSG